MFNAHTHTHTYIYIHIYIYIILYTYIYIDIYLCIGCIIYVSIYIYMCVGTQCTFAYIYLYTWRIVSWSYWTPQTYQKRRQKAFGSTGNNICTPCVLVFLNLNHQLVHMFHAWLVGFNGSAVVKRIAPDTKYWWLLIYPSKEINGSSSKNYYESLGFRLPWIPLDPFGIPLGSRSQRGPLVFLIFASKLLDLRKLFPARWANSRVLPAHSSVPRGWTAARWESAETMENFNRRCDMLTCWPGSRCFSSVQLYVGRSCGFLISRGLRGFPMFLGWWWRVPFLLVSSRKTDEKWIESAWCQPGDAHSLS